MPKHNSSASRTFKEGEETLRTHIWLYASDVEWIDQHVDAVKRSKFIRLALRKVIKSYQDRAERQAAQAVKPQALRQHSAQSSPVEELEAEVQQTEASR